MKTDWHEKPQRFRPGRLAPEQLPAAATPSVESPVPYARTRENPLEVLKNRLLREILTALEEPTLLAPLRRAANDAAALAWLEPFPLLVFPELFAEKVWAAGSQAKQQHRIRNRSVRLMEVLT